MFTGIPFQKLILTYQLIDQLVKLINFFPFRRVGKLIQRTSDNNESSKATDLISWNFIFFQGKHNLNHNSIIRFWIEYMKIRPKSIVLNGFCKI